jgi:hypothetical protein
MVYNDRSTCKDRHAAELIVARKDVLHPKAVHCRRLVFSTVAFPLQSCAGPFIIDGDPRAPERNESATVTGDRIT